MRTNHGFSKVELLVASSLLSALVLIAVPLITRLQNVWKSTRMYQIATFETAIGSLQVSERLKASLPNAELTGELVRIEEETRIVLRMRLDPAVRQEPLILIGWLSSDQESSP